MRFLGNQMLRRSSLVLAMALLALLATACGASTAEPAPIDHSTMAGMDHTAMTGAALPREVSIDAVHAAYLDTTGNISDLRVRIALWQAGDDSGINIAKEKLDRIEILLSSTTWPASLDGAVAKIRQGVGSMKSALAGTNLKGAVAIAKVLGDAAHDLTHDFYGVWLPQTKGRPLPAMATHVIYLDLSANIADLKSRVAKLEAERVQQASEGLDSAV